MPSRDDGGLRALFRAHMPGAQWTTVETGAVSRGVPDAEFCWPGAVQGWVEFKACRKGWAVRMRPEQIAWLSRRARYGGRCWIAVRRTDNGNRDDLYLYRGALASEVAAMGCKLQAYSLMSQDGPSSWDWSIIEETLRS